MNKSMQRFSIILLAAISVIGCSEPGIEAKFTLEGAEVREFCFKDYKYIFSGRYHETLILPLYSKDGLPDSCKMGDYPDFDMGYREACINGTEHLVMQYMRNKMVAPIFDSNKNAKSCKS